MRDLLGQLQRLAALPASAATKHRLQELLPAVVAEMEALREEVADWKAIAGAAQKQLDAMAEPAPAGRVP